MFEKFGEEIKIWKNIHKWVIYVFQLMRRTQACSRFRKEAMRGSKIRKEKSIRKQGLASMGLKHEEDSADQPNFPYAQGGRDYTLI